MMEHYAPPPNNVIRSLIQHPHAMSIYAKNMPYPLKSRCQGAQSRYQQYDIGSRILWIGY